MASPTPSEQEISKLQSELRELRKLKKDFDGRKAAKSKVQIFLMKLWAGPALSNSLEDWMRAKQEDDTGATISATANLMAAVFRRFMRVGFILILLAVIPMILIVWQNIIMERQNQSLINQIKAERTASSNQQVTEYLRLLLSSDDKQVKAAEGFLVSDLVNRDLAVERLAALLKSGDSDVQCSALTALNRIVGSSAELTLKDAIAPQTSERAVISDVQCGETEIGFEGMNFTGVDFGAITFSGVGFPKSNFKSADLSDVEFQDSNLRHTDFSESHLCKSKKSCVSFLETDLSYASLILTDRNKDVFKQGTILVGAQLKFDRPVPEAGRAEQTTTQNSSFQKFSRDSPIAKGVCYNASFSQCYALEKAKALGN